MNLQKYNKLPTDYITCANFLSGLKFELKNVVSYLLNLQKHSFLVCRPINVDWSVLFFNKFWVYSGQTRKTCTQLPKGGKLVGNMYRRN